MPRIACLHTAESNGAVFDAAARMLRLLDLKLRHSVRPDLLAAAEQAGRLTPYILADGRRRRIASRRPPPAQQSAGRPCRRSPGRGILVTMLELRPNCECCDRDLPPGSTEARICTFECTFCAECTDTILQGRCPNCGGNLVARPIRPADKLLRAPASTKRVLKAHGCSPA